MNKTQLRAKSAPESETSGAAVEPAGNIVINNPHPLEQAGQSGASAVGKEIEAAAPKNLTRDNGLHVMNAIDDLRKRLVKEIKSGAAANAKNPDVSRGIELRQKQTYLNALAELHQTVGEAFNLGGY